MTTKKESANEARINELLGKVTNKDKREAVKHFETSYNEMDNLDLSVLLAFIASERKRSIEELDALPLNELETIIGIEDDAA